MFLPENTFPNPLTWTWSHTKGADLMWVPIGFRRSFQMAYSRTHYGTGYYIYHQFVDGIPLSDRIHSWNSNEAPDAAVLQLLSRPGTGLAPIWRLNEPPNALVNSNSTAAPPSDLLGPCRSFDS